MDSADASLVAHVGRLFLRGERGGEDGLLAQLLNPGDFVPMSHPFYTAPPPRASGGLGGTWLTHRAPMGPPSSHAPHAPPTGAPPMRYDAQMPTPSINHEPLVGVAANSPWGGACHDWPTMPHPVAGWGREGKAKQVMRLPEASVCTHRRGKTAAIPRPHDHGDGLAERYTCAPTSSLSARRLGGSTPKSAGCFANARSIVKSGMIPTGESTACRTSQIGAATQGELSVARAPMGPVTPLLPATAHESNAPGAIRSDELMEPSPQAAGSMRTVTEGTERTHQGRCSSDSREKGTMPRDPTKCVCAAPVPPLPVAESGPLLKGEAVVVTAGRLVGESATVLRLDEDGDLYLKLSDGSRQVVGCEQVERASSRRPAGMEGASEMGQPVAAMRRDGVAVPTGCTDDAEIQGPNRDAMGLCASRRTERLEGIGSEIAFDAQGSSSKEGNSGGSTSITPTPARLWNLGLDGGGHRHDQEEPQSEVHVSIRQMPPDESVGVPGSKDWTEIEQAMRRPMLLAPCADAMAEVTHLRTALAAEAHDMEVRVRLFASNDGAAKFGDAGTASRSDGYGGFPTSAQSEELESGCWPHGGRSINGPLVFLSNEALSSILAYRQRMVQMVCEYGMANHGGGDMDEQGGGNEVAEATASSSDRDTPFKSHGESPHTGEPMAGPPYLLGVMRGRRLERSSGDARAESHTSAMCLMIDECDVWWVDGDNNLGKGDEARLTTPSTVSDMLARLSGGDSHRSNSCDDREDGERTPSSQANPVDELGAAPFRMLDAPRPFDDSGLCTTPQAVPSAPSAASGDVVGWIYGSAGLGTGPPCCSVRALNALADVSARISPGPHAVDLLGQPRQAWRLVLAVDVLACTAATPAVAAHLFLSGEVCCSSATSTQEIPWPPDNPPGVFLPIQVHIGSA